MEDACFVLWELQQNYWLQTEAEAPTLSKTWSAVFKPWKSVPPFLETYFSRVQCLTYSNTT